MDKAVTVVTVLALGLMLLGGFYVNTTFKYAYDASLQLIFDENVPCDESGQLAPCQGHCSTTFWDSKEVLCLNVGMLIVSSLVALYVAYLALRASRNLDRC